MSIELTEQQRDVLDAESPPLVVDPKTKAVYVLVPAETYERLKAFLAIEPFEPDSMYALLAEFAPEDWEDAANYDEPTL
jgi:hypothetical protein